MIHRNTYFQVELNYEIIREEKRKKKEKENDRYSPRNNVLNRGVTSGMIINPKNSHDFQEITVLRAAPASQDVLKFQTS